jgi:hypothetical protein
MAIPSCYAGKVLFVDLSTGIIREEVLPENGYRDFVGGNGLGVRVLSCAGTGLHVRTMCTSARRIPRAILMSSAMAS